MRALLVLVVVLAIALVAGDRATAYAAEHEIAKRIAAQYNLSQQPRVDIHGVPFLTQAVGGRYPEVEVAVGDWAGPHVTVHDLDVRLTDVRAPLGDVLHDRTENMVAATATATALLPYDAVRTFAPRGVESIADSADGLHVTGTFSVGGIPVPATVVLTVAPADNGITVTPVAVQSAAGGPELSLSLLRQALTFTVPLQRLPLGADITAIHPAAGGLLVTAAAHNVRFNQSLPTTLP